ncbi:MAG: response regulator, partial [Bacteroidota bacterium]
VDNALKFTQEGEIRVEVEMLTQQAEEVQIQFLVSDTGIGIAPEQVNSIFDNFIQASKDTTRKFDGTGLGLSIVKQLIELMGGEIEVRSQLDQGSAFTVQLPFQLVAQAPLPADEHPVELSEDEPSLHGRHILIVEDILMNRKVVARMLEGWGGTTSIATDGLEAVKICQTQRFDLILMDIQMPNLDGYDATRQIRASEGPNQGVPIIALTASTRARVKEQVLEVGMNAYVLKPFEPKELYRIIQQQMPAAIPQAVVELAPPPPPISTEPSPTIPALPVKATPVEAPVDSQESDQVDMSYLRTLGGGDEEFIKEMVQIFLSQTPTELASLETHIGNRDWEQVKQGAHKLKYPFSSIGRRDLFTLLTKMEANALEAQDPQVAELQIARLKTESTGTFQSLQGLF